MRSLCARWISSVTIIICVNKLMKRLQLTEAARLPRMAVLAVAVPYGAAV